MKNHGKEQERKVLVTIRSQRRPVTLESWRYWEIVGELLFMGADRFEAYEAARWCGSKATPGDKKELSCGITMEVMKDA